MKTPAVINRDEIGELADRLLERGGRHTTCARALKGQRSLTTPVCPVNWPQF
jgi:hypothetical protein